MRVSAIILGQLAASLTMAAAYADGSSVSAPEVVSSLEETFGVHPGQRRNHIKGTCAAGTFVGTRAVAALSRSKLFTGDPVPVVARFSVAGGNPQVPDAARNARGLALEFRFADGLRQHMTMLNTPVFGAAHPETFNAMLIAARPDPATGKPNPDAMQAFLATHPDALAQASFLTTHNPPRSYANGAYYGIHTFKFVDATDGTHLVKWEFVPRDGIKELAAAEINGAPHDFLEARLLERLAHGPAEWDMLVTIGEPGDAEDNPTVQWPQQRRKVTAGRLTITAASAQSGAPCEKINFDPLVMADGIAPTNDPVLLFRSPAYALSFAKRLAAQ